MNTSTLLNPKFAIAILSLFATLFIHTSTPAQTKSIILGRPTDNSVTASILFDQATEFYLEYGTQPGTYTASTPVYTTVANTPDEIDLTGLSPNTRYYYRMLYRPVAGGAYAITPEYTFHTQRAIGSTFIFTIEADEHLYDKKGCKNLLEITLANQAADNPDFMLSLGDIFGDDHDPFGITSGALDTLHSDYRPLLGEVCHSIPIYVCLGNHEGENDYYNSFTPPNNLCVWGTQWRKFYYPNPFPNGFYSGNTDIEPYGIGNPENYYAWNWGDALFVVLDVYRDQCDTSAMPKNWNWSLGLPQYTWLKNTLENSNAPYKFVFAHHVSGFGRGGITEARRFEWGGYDGQNATNYSFPVKRPGWAKPIHQLFVDNGVNVFFQGHDHVFAHEVMDSVVYQAMPMAADSTYQIGMLANADAYTADTLDGSGHLRVTVSPSCTLIEYIRAYLPADTVGGLHQNGEVAFSYTVGPCSTSGVQEPSSTVDVKVFPNPVNDVLQVDMHDKTMLRSLSLQNALGETLLESPSSSLDLSNMPAGVYFLRISTTHGSVVRKVIVSH